MGHLRLLWISEKHLYVGVSGHDACQTEKRRRI